jgi:hypothetical protein
MVKISTDRKIGIYAQSSYGKTWLAKRIIEFICKNNGRVVVYDTDYNDSKYHFSDIKNCHVFKPDNRNNDNPKYLNEFLLEIRQNYSDLFIFIDDIDVFFNKSSVLSFDFAELKDAASRGRHQRIGLIYTSKIASYIPTQLVQNTNLFYIGVFPTLKSVKSLDTIVDYEDIKKLDYNKHEFLEIDGMNNYSKRVV